MILYKQFITKIIMKKNLNDSKKETPKQITNSYLSSYAEKYKKKGGKPFEYERVAAGQSKSSFQIESKTSINTPGRSRESPLKRSVDRRKQFEQKPEQNEWIGQDVPSIGIKEVAILQTRKSPMSPCNEQSMEQSISSIEPSSPHELMLRRQSNILIEEQIQEDLNVYQHYRILEQQYQQQLEKIKEETEKIQREFIVEKKRIAESEQTLLLKKKKLKELEDTYGQIVHKNETEKSQQLEVIRIYEAKLAQLKKKHVQTKISRKNQKAALQNDLQSTKNQNDRLLKQLSQLQAQLESVNQSQKDQDKTINELESQQHSLLQEIASLQKQQTDLKKQIQQLDQTKPQQSQTSQLHKRYLQIYEKMFITAQLHKAEEILRLKEQEKHQMQQFQKRKSMLKDKKIEIALKQKRINQKNKLVDQLTLQIREKSTILLNLYQQQS